MLGGWAGLRREFERFGAVRDVYLPRDFHTKRPKGFGFVEFVEEPDADAAQRQMDRQHVFGRPIQVEFARHGRKDPNQMRGGGGGGRYGGPPPRSPPPRDAAEAPADDN
eukprot:PRCOL_00002175-RA